MAELTSLPRRALGLLPSDLKIQCYEQGRKLARQILRASAKVLAAWRHADRSVLRGSEQARHLAGRNRAGKSAHEWWWCHVRSCFVCNRCLITCRNRDSARPQCRRMPAKMISIAVCASSLHHIVYCAQVGNRGMPSLIYCRRCGHYAESRAVGLGQACRGGHSKQRSRLRALVGGRHPVHGGRLVSGKRFCAACFDPCARHQHVCIMSSWVGTDQENAGGAGASGSNSAIGGRGVGFCALRVLFVLLRARLLRL